MKNYLYIKVVFFTIFFGSVNAQPVLTAADFPSGQEFRYSIRSSATYCCSISTTPFSFTINSYISSPTDVITMSIPVASVPNSANHPTSTSATKTTYSDGQIFYVLYETTPLTHKIIASGYSNSILSRNDTLYTFPYSFGSNNSAYTSYGSIITPTGTYSNIIRTYTSTISSGYQTQTTTSFATNPYKILRQSISYGGNGTSGGFSSYYEYLPYNLSNSEFKNNIISIFPNPTPGDFQISNSNYLAENLFITIYDLLGKEVLPKQQIISETQTINSALFDSGLYILKISNKENQVLHTEKIIKN